MNSIPENAVVDKAVAGLRSFVEVDAVGLSGSRVRGLEDAESDYDFIVFARDSVPSADDRRQAYARHGITEFAYFDADLEVCRDDGLVVDGVRCETVWLSVPFVSRFLAALDTDFACDEFLPGGLLHTQPLHDPNGTLERLKGEVPEYSQTRAVHRLREHLGNAHFHIYVLRWFDKAAARNDPFSFSRHLHDVVEDLVTCLFALNRRWYCDEKRVTDILGQLELAPERIGERLTAILMHKNENAKLDTCLSGLKALLRESSVMAAAAFPGSGFPEDWE